MDSSAYQSLCNQPNAFPRAVLEATRRAVSSNLELESALRKELERAPIPKPPLHDGGRETDYFLIAVGENEAEQIVDLLFNAEVASVGLDGETTAMASGYASLIDLWSNYLEFNDFEFLATD